MPINALVYSPISVLITIYVYAHTVAVIVLLIKAPRSLIAWQYQEVN